MTSTPTRPVDNVVIATKGIQDRNTNILAGTTVENKGKLILPVVCRTRIQSPNSDVFAFSIGRRLNKMPWFIK